MALKTLQTQTPQQKPATFTPVSGILQRQCACGNHTSEGGECEACRKKRGQRHATTYTLPEFAPPIACAFTKPRFGHDFSQVKVQGTHLREVNPCVQKLYQRASGETGCDVSIGTPSTTLHDPPACYRECVARHEKVHAHDISPCCKRANRAYKAAKNDGEKEKLQEKFNRWIEANEDWLECRAYAESARCGKELVDKNCTPKKSQAEAISGSDLSDEEMMPLVSLDTGPQTARANSKNTSLAEGKEGEGKEKPSPKPSPEVCCPSVRRYRRVSEGRRDTVCGRAKKNLSPCPF